MQPRANTGAPLEVVWHEGDEAVVFKPAGLSSERGPGDPGDSVATRCVAQFGWSRCLLPHRLDRPTRGLLVVTGSSDAAARCSEEIRQGAWTKWYVARLPASDARTPAATLKGVHRAYLKRVGRLATVVRSGGDPSRLEILEVDRASDDPTTAFALIRLDTGRFHQIRVMLASLGYPLIGDVEYGGRRGASRAPGEAASIDLEAIALRIERPGQARIHRIPVHPNRIGVPATIETALDRILIVR